MKRKLYAATKELVEAFCAAEQNWDEQLAVLEHEINMKNRAISDKEVDTDTLLSCRLVSDFTHLSEELRDVLLRANSRYVLLVMLRFYG